MKRKILLSIVLVFVFTINLNAQLKVKKLGDVKIGVQTTWPSGGKLEITGINKTLETRIFSTSANISRLWTINSKYAFAFGIDINGYGHIYRNINSPYSIMTFKSNGYFGIGRTPYYKLDVNGSIRVSYTIYSSDRRLKSNVTPISYQTKNLFKLNSVSYNLNDIIKKSEKVAQTETMDSTKIISEPPKYDNRIHYGFIAQEVRKIYPELVYEDEEGMLGIDYVAFIPLLIEELKQQNKSIEKLRKEVEILKTTSINSLQTDENNTLGELYQNIPNPFNVKTTIKFKLSNTIKSATLYLFDPQGKQVKNYLIRQGGESSITIKGSELQPGMYLYSLIADGKLINTKTMILTN